MSNFFDFCSVALRVLAAVLFVWAAFKQRPIIKGYEIHVGWLGLGVWVLAVVLGLK